MKYICDIETDGLLREATKIHCLVLRNIDTDEVLRFNEATINEGINLLAKADMAVFHNGINFDVPCIRKLYPTVRLNCEIVDTLVLSRVLFSDILENDLKDFQLQERLKEGKALGKHSLKAWGIRLLEHKGDFEGPWTHWSQEMEDYCVQDTHVTFKLYEFLKAKQLDPECWELEHKFAKVCSEVTRRGVKFDLELALQFTREWEERIKSLELQLGRIFKPTIETTKTPSYYFVNINGERFEGPTKGKLTDDIVASKVQTRAWLKDNIKQGPLKVKVIPFNPRSGQQVAERLSSKYGWKPTKFTETGQPYTGGEVLKELSYEGAKLLADYKDVIKIYDMIKGGDGSWLNQVHTDGRLYGNIISNGAVTGRCTHNSPNLAQIPGKGNPLGSYCRAMFVPSEGMSLLGWDASSLEMRCLAHYMHRFDQGEFANVVTTGDPHEHNRKAAGLETRDQAKTFFYALIYGAGDAKIGSIIGGSELEGRRLRAKFLNSMPAFDALVKLVKKVHKEKGTIKGLDGRDLPIRSQHAVLNTLLQSAGAVLMKKAVVNQEIDLRKNYSLGVDYNTILLVHDEVQLEVVDKLTNEIRQKLYLYLPQAGDYFDFKCPLAVEVSEPGESWKETH